jgi:integrase
MARITEQALKKLRSKQRITDDAIEGFVARCLPSGKVTFGYQYTDRASGARRWMGIGLHGAVTVDEARNLAKRYAGQVASHGDPAAELKTRTARSENTVDYVLDKFIEIYVPRLRSAAEITRALGKYVRPAIGSSVIYDLDRADIARMLDKIAKDHPRMADLSLAYLRKAFNWWQTRDGKFRSPIVFGMARGLSTQERARDRVLTDQEIADLWRALAELESFGGVTPCFPAFVRTLLLTGCRRCEVSAMHTREFDGDEWTIPKERYKTGRQHTLPLVPAIKKYLPDHKFGFVFTTDGGKTSFKNYSETKKKLDQQIDLIRKRDKRPPMPAWCFHDLRRTARTLMAAAGIADNVAERVLGHALSGVHGIYNRHDYAMEKTEALTRLAAHIDRIVGAPTTATRKLRAVRS